ncbi:MAG: hypothetical protein HY903_14565 [Deltaproteobacteria bacterium]|nr:hypothetical protein [Deltaproteobacteria bacterium]
MKKAHALSAKPAASAPRFYACGVFFSAPEAWQDRTVHAFVGPRLEDGLPVAKSRYSLKVNPSVSIVSLGAMDLSAAIEAMPPPKEVDDLTVLAEGRKTEAYGEVFERVVRYTEPIEELAVQQSLRLVALGGEVFALTFSCTASAFNRQYDLFADLAQAFVAEKQRDKGRG